MIPSEPDQSPPADPVAQYVSAGTVLEFSAAGGMHDRVRAFAAALDARASRQSLWPVPPHGRQAYVDHMLAAAAIVGMISQHCEGRGWLASCAALVCPACAGSATAAIHFLGYSYRSLDEQEAWLAACAKFISEAHSHWPALTCAIPRPWHGPRQLCRALGFQELAQFPRAALAYMPKPRLVDLAFLAHWPEQFHGSPAQA